MAGIALQRASRVLHMRDHELATLAAVMASAALELDRWATGRALGAEEAARRPGS